MQVAVNYAKYVVDIALGYYLGQPVKYDANPVDELGRKVELAPLLRCYERGDISRRWTCPLAGQWALWATAWSCATPRAAAIPCPAPPDRPRRGILVCDTTVEHAKLFGMVWDRREKDHRRAVLFRHRLHGSHGAGLCLLRSERRCVPAGGRGALSLVRRGAHDRYVNNDDRQGDFEQILSLIDAYDALMSSRLTDKKKFVDALLVFFGMTLAEGTSKSWHGRSSSTVRRWTPGRSTSRRPSTRARCRCWRTIWCGRCTR